MLQAERGEVAGLRVAKEAAVSEKLRLQVSAGGVCKAVAHCYCP
jgi:hypothetical protein